MRRNVKASIFMESRKRKFEDDNDDNKGNGDDKDNNEQEEEQVTAADHVVTASLANVHKRPSSAGHSPTRALSGAAFLCVYRERERSFQFVDLKRVRRSAPVVLPSMHTVERNDRPTPRLAQEFL